MTSDLNIYNPKVDKDTKLVVHDLKVYFPLRRRFIIGPRLYVKANDGVTFDVKEGEVFALAGESGCGKTTTGKAILRLVEINGGSITYLPSERIAKEISSLPGLKKVSEHGHINLLSIPEKHYKPLRRDIQMIWQDPYGSLNPRRTIFETLEEPLDIHHPELSRSERIEIVAKSLEDVKLTPPDEFMWRYPHMLSGGQRQRVVIARALITKPTLVVADEPVSMIDVSLRAEILQLMMELKKTYGLTYIFITHDLALARYISNRLGIMYLGKIVEVGDTRKVVEEPYHPYARALIEAIPEPEPERRHVIKELPIKGEVPSPVNIPPGCRFHPRCVVLDQHPELRSLCTKKEPPLVEISSGRYVACWLYAKR